MVNKKGQGISISFIVVAAIAALVLVLVIAFATGGLGKFFGSMMGTSKVATGSADSAKIQCEKYCNEAKGTGYTLWSKSRYCTSSFNIDFNEDGAIDPDSEIFHCWDGDIGLLCPFSSSDGRGYTITCEYTDCPAAEPADPSRRCCGTGCKEATFGEVVNCAAIGTDQTLCIDAGCTWGGVNCGGTPECNTLDYEECVSANQAGSCLSSWSQLEYDPTSRSCF